MVVEDKPGTTIRTLADEQHIGVVVTHNSSYGYIKADDSNSLVLFRSWPACPLKVGNRVSFDADYDDYEETVAEDVRLLVAETPPVVSEMRSIGVVITINDYNGYVRMDDSDDEVFFQHWTTPTIKVGDRVSFEYHLDQVDGQQVACDVQRVIGEATPVASPERSTGTVKWFNAPKGYGFIVLDGGGEDVFVHYSAIQMDGYKRLAEDDRVSFEIIHGEKGLKAQNVRLIHEPQEEVE